MLFVLLLIARKYRRFHGQIFAMWLMGYAMIRSTVELFRGDFERGTLHKLIDQVPLDAWWNISTSQFISLVMFALGVTLLVRGSSASRELPSASAPSLGLRARALRLRGGVAAEPTCVDLRPARVTWNPGASRCLLRHAPRTERRPVPPRLRRAGRRSPRRSTVRPRCMRCAGSTSSTSSAWRSVRR